MKLASFDAWMNAEYWIGGPKGVDFSTRYSAEQLRLMRSSFMGGCIGVHLKDSYIKKYNENTQYLIDLSYQMGELFTKRLNDEQSNP